MEEFPTIFEDLTEANVQNKIEDLEQGDSEPVAVYYHRTVGMHP